MVKLNLKDLLGLIKKYKMISRMLALTGQPALAAAASMAGYGPMEGLTQQLWAVLRREMRKPRGKRTSIYNLVRELKLISRFLEHQGHKKTAKVARLLGFGNARNITPAQALKRIRKLNKEVLSKMGGNGMRNMVGDGFFSRIGRLFAPSIRRYTRSFNRNLRDFTYNPIKYTTRQAKSYVRNFKKNPISSVAGLATGFVPGLGFVGSKIASRAVKYGVNKITGKGAGTRTRMGGNGLIVPNHVNVTGVVRNSRIR